MPKSFKPATATRLGAAAILGGSLLMASGTGAAADWSDTSIGIRNGSKFAEPFGRTDIGKNIVNLTHVSGYKYGTNFFNADLLLSDKKDPGSSAANAEGAQEVYIVYRNTVDLSKVTSGTYKFGPVKGMGVTVGFDANVKNDAGYNSRKRMGVLGPTFFIDVPGVLNVSLLQLWESNAPCSTFGPPSCVPRYSYKTHPMLTANWGIPIGSSLFSYEGFINVIASKGNNEFGAATARETNFDSQVMFDVGAALGGPKGTFKIGLEYQWWKNKFGNNASGAAGPGAFAKTPMIRAEYHF